MKHIKNFLPHISISNRHQNWKFQLMNQWTTIMGSLASKISIYKIYNDSITLGVTDSSWMHELYLLSNLIKQKINATFDKPRIETIRFHYINPNNPSSKTATFTSQPSIVKERLLTTQEKKALEKINDPELSQALTRLLQKCHP